MKSFYKSLKYIIPLFLFVTLSLGILLWQEINVHATNTNNGYMKFPDFNPEAEEGTEENPFIILEIVPYRGMGQIGYIVGGQEPVDPSVSKPDNSLFGVFNGFAHGAFETYSVKKEELSEEDMKYSWAWEWDGNHWTNKLQYDWLFRNTEIFKREVLGISNEKLSDYHVRVVTITPEELNKNVNKFSKYYDLDNGGRNLKVYEGPDENGEIDLIGNADLISISPKAHAGNNTVIDLWEKYGRDRSGLIKSNKNHSMDFNDHDLSWQTTMELFMKIGIVEDSAGFIYDMSMITSPAGDKKNVQGPISDAKGTGYINNVYKLCLMVRQMDPEMLYNDYFNTNEGTITPKVTVHTYSKGRTTGKHDGLKDYDSKIYWNYYTFLPPFPDGTYPPWITATNPDYRQYLVDMGIILGWSEHHTAVIRNTYSYNGDTDIVQRFININYNLREISETKTSVGYNKEFFDYLEKLAKEKDPNASRPINAAPMNGIDYILKYVKPKGNRKASITVLDLEPSNDFTLTVDMVRDMVGTYSGQINIVQMTTAEFIGKGEDLYTIYDMIYIGTKTGKMNTKDGKTTYNDPLMDGLIYSHVGDRVIAFDTFRGILGDLKAAEKINFGWNLGLIESNIFKGYRWLYPFETLDYFTADFYRFPGNDITSIKMEELQSFVDGGLPVLLDDKLYSLDKGILDDSSYLYKFISNNIYKNHDDQVLFDAQVILSNSKDGKEDRKRLNELLGKEKLSVKMNSVPTAYKENDESTLLISGGLSYSFKIIAPSDGKIGDIYKWSILVDQNGDGRYEDKELLASGQSKADVNIWVNESLSSGYYGAIPWKLIVSNKDNSNISTEVTGLSAIKDRRSNLDKMKEQINVLQITANNSTMNLEDLSDPVSGKTSLFYKYTKDLDSFNFNIRTITVSEFESFYVGKGNRFDINNPDGTDKLKDYDMLILGFGKHYSDISNKYGALDNILAFINIGKGVLYTHDTTSFVNVSKASYDFYNKDLPYWGYGFNKYLRGRAGMDRFGTLKKSGDGTLYDRATMPSKARNKNIYKGNPDTYPEIQGLTYGALVAYSNPNNLYPSWGDWWEWLEYYDLRMGERHKANKDYPPFAYGNEFKQGTAIDRYETDFVTKVNDGQITSYPYNIPKGIRVGTTHMQYYQLNMDDPEIRVWYALSDEKSYVYKDNHDLGHSGETGPYSVSPNDVRNNYYLYSKDNIVYTGLGNMAIDSLVDVIPENPEYEYEVKLFINTLVATYRLGTKAPEVTITNEDARQNSDLEYIFYENFEGISYKDKIKKIRFIGRDTNPGSAMLTVGVYQIDDLGEATLINAPVKSIKGDLAQSSSEGYLVEHGKEYYIEYPMTIFGEQGNDKLLITVTNRVNRKGSARAQIIGRVLFDLD